MLNDEQKLSECSLKAMPSISHSCHQSHENTWDQHEIRWFAHSVWFHRVCVLRAHHTDACNVWSIMILQISPALYRTCCVWSPGGFTLQSLNMTLSLGGNIFSLFYPAAGENHQSDRLDKWHQTSHVCSTDAEIWANKSLWAIIWMMMMITNEKHKKILLNTVLNLTKVNM